LYFHRKIEFYKSFPDVEQPSNHVVLGVGYARGGETLADFYKGLRTKRLRQKRIFLMDLKYVHRMTRKQAELVARRADRASRRDKGDLLDDSSDSDELSDTDNEVSKEVFM
jgi:hypothetical protein